MSEDGDGATRTLTRANWLSGVAIGISLLALTLQGLGSFHVRNPLDDWFAVSAVEPYFAKVSATTDDEILLARRFAQKDSVADTYVQIVAALSSAHSQTWPSDAVSLRTVSQVWASGYKLCSGDQCDQATDLRFDSEGSLVDFAFEGKPIGRQISPAQQFQEFSNFRVTFLGARLWPDGSLEAAVKLESSNKAVRVFASESTFYRNGRDVLRSRLAYQTAPMASPDFTLSARSTRLLWLSYSDTMDMNGWVMLKAHANGEDKNEFIWLRVLPRDGF